MRKGLSLVALAQQIEANASQKVDAIVPTSEITMQVVENKPVLEIPFVAPANSVVTLPSTSQHNIRAIAHNQIGERLKIPAKYYDRMQTEAPDLLATNVNAWFRRQPEKRLVRMLGGDVRAFLSNRYQRIEHEEIAEVALPILLGDKQLQVVSSEITERRLYIQATTPRITRDVKVGDAVQAGVIISNSEVGSGAVSIQRMVYRLRCLNGMVLPDSGYRAAHIGRKIEDNSELWADDTRQADDKAILLKVRDMVSAALDDKSFELQVAKMSELAGAAIVGDPIKGIEILAKKIGASEGEKGSILRALVEGGDMSAWGVLNAVTAQAHTTVDYDRSVEFEALGGNLLNLAPSEWKEVLAA